MKKLLPLVMLILGLGAGVGAGMVLKPKPPEKTAACAAHAAGHGAEAAPAATGQGAAAAPCPEDPVTPEPEHAAEDAAAEEAVVPTLWPQAARETAAAETALTFRNERREIFFMYFYPPLVCLLGSRLCPLEHISILL